MATFSIFAKWTSKCRRKYLFEAQFGSSLINYKWNNLLLRNYLLPGVCFIRHFALKSFPWTQSTTDIYPRDPFLHRLCGSLILYKAMKQVPDIQLHPKEFLKSAKDCVLFVSDIICQMDSENKLSDLLGSSLDKIFREAFAMIFNHKLNLHLEVSDVSNLHIAAVRNIMGPLEPSSECYALDTVGQWLYIDPADAENFWKGSKDMMKLGKSTARRGCRVQIGVKFLAKEKFYITGSEGEILTGSKNSVLSHHMWLFESIIDHYKLYKKEYPLSWRVVDMDKTVRLPKFKSFLNE